jgi:hypothetical protein
VVHCVTPPGAGQVAEEGPLLLPLLLPEKVD